MCSARYLITARRSYTRNTSLNEGSALYRGGNLFVTFDSASRMHKLIITIAGSRLPDLASYVVIHRSTTSTDRHR